ncbi:MAG: hypothetical protein AB8I08_16470 [Sandaracinaceae bacterium]
MNVTLVSPLGTPTSASLDLKSGADVDAGLRGLGPAIPIVGLDGAPTSLRLSCLDDLEPFKIVFAHPPALRLVVRRTSLCCLRGPLGGIPRFRKTVQREWAADVVRDRLAALDEAALRRHIRSAKDADEGLTLVRTLALTKAQGEQHWLETIAAGLEDFLVELLRPEWRGIRVSADMLHAGIRRFDERVTRWLDDEVFGDETVTTWERAVRSATALASHGRLRWVLTESAEAPTPKLEAPEGPRPVLIVDRPVHLQGDIGKVAAWVEAGRRAGYERVFLPLAPSLSRLATTEPERLLRALESLPLDLRPWLRLAVGQVRLRLSHRQDAVRVREFAYKSRHLDAVAGTTALQLAVAWSQNRAHAPVLHQPGAGRPSYVQPTGVVDAWTELGGLDRVPSRAASSLLEAGLGWVCPRRDHDELEHPVALRD